MPCSVLVAFKGIARRAWGRPLAARGWWAQTSQKVNFAYCTDHRPVQPSHIESAINQLCFMKPSTLIYVCLFSSPRSCKQGPSFELSSSVPACARCLPGERRQHNLGFTELLKATISRQAPCALGIGSQGQECFLEMTRDCTCLCLKIHNIRFVPKPFCQCSPLSEQNHLVLI